MRNLFFVALLVVLPVGVGEADTLWLKDGRRIDGTIIEETETRILIDVPIPSGGMVRVGFRLEDIEELERTGDLVELYQERLESMASENPQAHWELAQWCRSKKLVSFAVEHFTRGWEIAPRDVRFSEALHELGYVLGDQGDRWLTEEEYYGAKGLIKFRGQWLRPEEKEALRLGETIDELGRDRERLERKLRKREKKIAKYNGQIDECMETIDASRKELAELHAEIAPLRPKLSKARARLSRYYALYRQQSPPNPAVMAHYANALMRVASLENSVNARELRIKRLEKRIETNQKKAAALETEIRELKPEMKEWTTQRDELEKQRQAAAAELEKLYTAPPAPPPDPDDEQSNESSGE